MRRLVVDGHNLLRSTDRYRDIAARDIDAARDRLVADLQARAAGEEHVTVVFDGGGNPGSDGTPATIGAVTVIYSPHGTEADQVIERLAAEARKSGDEMRVVSSDAATRAVAAGARVTTLHAASFAQELDLDAADVREAAAPARPRATIESRLDESTKRRLRRMSGG